MTQRESLAARCRGFALTYAEWTAPAGLMREAADELDLLKHDMEFACQQRDEARLKEAQWKTLANERHDRIQRLEAALVAVTNYAIEFLDPSDQLRIAELAIPERP